jgi:hypothetical protein
MDEKKEFLLYNGMNHAVENHRDQKKRRPPGIPTALPRAVAILDLRSNGHMGKNYASAQRAESAIAQGNALGMNELEIAV